MTRKWLIQLWQTVPTGIFSVARGVILGTEIQIYKSLQTARYCEADGKEAVLISMMFSHPLN
jgi:hypothetical protein